MNGGTVARPIDEGDTPDALSVAEVMAEVRASLRRDEDGAATTFYGADFERQLATLHSSWDVYHVDFPAGRPLVGKLLGFVKKAVRRMLAPVFGRQVAYNAANATVVQFLKEQCDVVAHHNARSIEELRAVQRDVRRALEEQIAALARGLESTRQLAQSIDAFRRQLAAEQERLHDDIRRELNAAAEHVRQLDREHVARTDRLLRRFLHMLDERGAQPSPREPLPARGDVQPAFDYFGFEERFRGDEKDIRARQHAYLDVFRGAQDVVDLGCGRGEFLELLREEGIRARGADSDLDMVLLCRDKGLDVSQTDVFAFLEGVSDGSLGGIFNAQMVEHFPADQTARFVKLCHRKLRPGAPLLIETVNPCCLAVFAHSFYLDPTHLRPIHPATLRYLFEATGFVACETRFSSPFPAAVRIPELPRGAFGDGVDEFNRGIARLNDLLYGDQDYAVIGRRSGEAAI